MPFKRILVLQSVQDAITERRKRKITNHPALNHYEFAFGYLVQLSDEQKRMPVPEMMREVLGQRFDADDLRERLVQQIHAFRPDLIVLHNGFVFHAFWQDITAELDMIRLQFPEIALGLQYFERTAPEMRKAFDTTPEVQALVAKIFAFEQRLPPFPNLAVPRFSKN